MEMTQDHKQKIREAVRASWTPERKEAMRQRRLGANNPFFGKSHTEEHREKISKSESGENNPFYGRQHTEETKRNIGRFKVDSAPLLKKYGVTDEEYKRRSASGERWCHHHKGFVHSSKFTGRTNGNSGVCAVCGPEYNRSKLLKLKYGVTFKWFDAKLKSQGGGCAICGSPVPVTGRKHLCIDHNHETGETRGILCYRCNYALERIEAVPNWTEKALTYLKHYDFHTPY